MWIDWGPGLREITNPGCKRRLSNLTTSGSFVLDAEPRKATVQEIETSVVSCSKLISRFLKYSTYLSSALYDSL